MGFGLVRSNDRLRRGDWLAFTLIELLVVVGVLSVLATLTGPALSRAKSAVVATKCRNNVRQLMLGLRMYVDDNRAYMLFAQTTGAAGAFWWESLAPFVGSLRARDKDSVGTTDCFMCPGVGSGATRSFASAVAYGYVDRGYAFQGIGERVTVVGSDLTSLAVTESEVRHPVETLAIGDGIAWLKSGFLVHSGLSLERWRRYTPSPLAGSLKSNLADLIAGDTETRALHKGRVEAGYCDGHVEANRLTFLFNDTRDAALRRWNRDNEPHREWLQP
jgi:prepilin-type N-terminal cleavage/methylation domain-containing protein/prepilin-type processing-associated H-X9-DG protein